MLRFEQFFPMTGFSVMQLADAVQAKALGWLSC